MSSSTKNDLERVVCLIDMDCFYVQVEEVAAPEFRGKPCGVSQYNPYKGGGLIAVNYEARKFGVKRGMRGEEAKALCPEFHIFFVQEKRGKADLSKYRDASAKIFEILGKNFKNVEKASIDEAYIDLTDLSLEAEKQADLNIELNDSFVVGKYAIPTDDNKIDQEANLKAWLDTVQHQESKALTNERLLAVGALLVQRVRKEIFDTLGFHCSAGLAHNKTLAKFCAGLNKPNRQTILPLGAVQDLYQRTPINKIKNLGGKLGIMLTDGLNLNTMSDLSKKSLSELTGIFGEKTGNWLHQISKGIDTEPVMSRRAAKSIGCSKNFRGNQVLNTHTKLEYWARNLCEELEERLESDKEMNQRDATLLVVHIANEAGSFSKSAALAAGGYCSKKLTGQTMEMLQGFNKSKIKDQWHPVIYGLGISATKFVSKEKPTNSIQKYFNAQAAKKSSKTESDHESKSRTSSSEGPIDLAMESDSNWNCDEETEQNIDEKSVDEEETENKQDKETNEKTMAATTTTTNQATKNKKPDIKNLLMKQAEKAATAVVNRTSNSRTSSSEDPIDLVVESDSNSNCNEETEDDNEKTMTANQATKNKKPDIKNLLMKQAEKAATAVVNKTNVSPPTKPATKEKKPDIKSMLLKQAEKAVVAPIILNINTGGSNKENAKKAENKTSKVDVKSLLLKQGEKAVKVRPKPVMRPHIERENTPKRNSSPPILITIGDSPEDDDYAQVRASLTKFAEKSAKKLGNDNKSTPSVKRLSIELTPLKAKPPKSAKKSKANDN